MRSSKKRVPRVDRKISPPLPAKSIDRIRISPKGRYYLAGFDARLINVDKSTPNAFAIRTSISKIGLRNPRSM